MDLKSRSKSIDGRSRSRGSVLKKVEPVYGLLQPKYMFGLSGTCQGAKVHFLNANKIVYPAGNTVVLHRIQNITQTFLHGLERSLGVTSIALTKSSTYCAVGQHGDKYDEAPIIAIFSILLNKRLKTLRHDGQMAAKEYISLAFTSDGRYLAALTGSPDYILYLWHWEKSHVMTQTRTTGGLGPVYMVLTSPTDHAVLSVCGNEVLRFVRMNEEGQALTPFGFQKGDSIHFLSMAWFGTGERLLAGTADGRIMLFEKGDYRCDIALPHDLHADPSLFPLNINENLQRTEVTALVAYSKGFAAGHGTGNVVIFELQEGFERPEDEYQHAYVIRVPPDTVNADDRIVNGLSICPLGETLLATSANSQIFIFRLSNCHIFDRIDMVFGYASSSSFHTGAVRCIDVAIGKPLFVTAGADGFIRVFNYISFHLEASKEVFEELKCVAFHPTGHYVLAVLTDKIRMYNVVASGLNQVRDILLRNCECAVFSHGGHYIAAGNDCTVQIFNSNTYDHTHKLNGHTNKIRKLRWSTDDTRLISISMDGSIYEWSVPKASYSAGVEWKETKWLDMSLSPETGNIYVLSGSGSKTIREMDLYTEEVFAEIELDLEPRCLTMSLTGKVMVAGMENGVVRSFCHPLTEQWFDFRMHSQAVNAIALTLDEAYCVSGSDDGSIVLWKVTDQDGRKSKFAKELVYSDKVLINRGDLELRELDMRDLRSRISEFEIDIAYNLKRKDMTFLDEVRGIETKFHAEIKNLNEQIHVLTETIEEGKRRFDAEVAQFEKDMETTVAQLEAFYKTRLIAEFEKYYALQKLIEDSITNYDDRAEAAEAQESEELTVQVEMLDDTLAAKTRQYDQMVDTTKVNLLESSETISQIEESVDEEILYLRRTYEQKLSNIRGPNSQLRSSIRMMEKNYAGMQMEIEQEKEHIQQMRLDKLKDRGVVRRNELAATRLKKDIVDVEEIAVAKEKVIFTLKRINLNLEMTKFVLDHQIQDLRKTVEPKQREVTYMKRQNVDMEGYLENQMAIRHALELRIHGIGQKLRDRNANYEEEKLRRTKTETLVTRIRSKMSESMGLLHDKIALRDAVKALHKKYGRLPSVDVDPVEQETICELVRQLGHLVLCMESMKRKTVLDKKMTRKEQLAMMRDNALLVQEIRDLRAALKNTTDVLREYDLRLGTSASTYRAAQIAEKRRVVSAAIQNRDDLVFDLDKKVETTDEVVGAQQDALESLANKLLNLKPKTHFVIQPRGSPSISEQEEFTTQL